MTTTRTAPQDDHPTTADQQPAPFLELSPSGEPIPVVSSLDLERDPHGLFRQWRSKSPVIQREDGACLVLRADDVERLLNDPRTQQIDGALYARMRGVPPGPLFDLLATSVLLSEVRRIADDGRPCRAPSPSGPSSPCAIRCGRPPKA